MGITIDYEYLEMCRKQSMLSNKAIAEASKVSESTVSKFFHAEMKDPSVHVLGAICDTIGASVDRACGIIKPIDEAMTDPSPSIPAVVADVVQSLPPLVDPQEVAQTVAQAVVDSPLVPDPIDPRKLAQEIVALLPAPQAPECESCRTARLYESTIAFHRQAIAILGGSLGLLVLILVAALFFR
jgi:transcriptional regulator with XRE-family HTH domain